MTWQAYASPRTRFLWMVAIPAIGLDVHLYNFGTAHLVAVFRDRLIECQNLFGTEMEARDYARRLADTFGCAMIEHVPSEAA